MIRDWDPLGRIRTLLIPRLDLDIYPITPSSIIEQGTSANTVGEVAAGHSVATVGLSTTVGEAPTVAVLRNIPALP
jgi:hypothetical protein